jgi:FkbM family methyltransferase
MLLSTMRQWARKFGLDVNRANYLTIPNLRIVHLLKQHQISCVLDVGANTGQFGKELFSSGYKGRIISVEPLPDAHRKLVAASLHHSNWDVTPQFALGSVSGTAKFHVAGNSVSSSLLPVAQIHVRAQPTSREIDTIQVQVRLLDDVFDSFKVGEHSVFLKLDTQGAEFDVLKGASRTLERVAGLMLELSLTELYHGQARFEELHAHVRVLGFELWDLLPGFREPMNARLLQVDGVYFRPRT